MAAGFEFLIRWRAVSARRIEWLRIAQPHSHQWELLGHARLNSIRKSRAQLQPPSTSSGHNSIVQSPL